MIKRDLLEIPPEGQAFSHTRPFFSNSAGLSNTSYQDKLVTQQIHILDFQPFFCDIKDLVKGGISLNHILKRQMITPFNLYFNQNDIIEVNLKKIKELRKRHLKQQIRSANLETKHSLHEQEKQDMLRDDNFIFFKKFEINLDMA